MRTRRVTLITVGIISIVILGVVVYLMKNAPQNTPVTSKVFIAEMKSRKYKVYTLKSNDFNNVTEQYKAYKKTNRGNSVQILFYEFASKEDARQAFYKLYEVVSPTYSSTFEFLNESGFFGNTQYFSGVSRSSSPVDTMMVSVENTLLIAQSDVYPITDGDDVFKALGYVYP